MSGTRIQHQERRLGIYYLRVRVPDDIRSLVGLTEVRRSLHTYSPTRARILSAVYSARLMEVFGMIKANKNDFTKDQVAGLVAGCFHDLIIDTNDGWAPETSEPDVERSEQRAMSIEAISDLKRQRDTQTYRYPVSAIAHEILARHQVLPTSLSPARLLDILDGVARAMIEQQRLFQLRLDDRLTPFEPVDPIFRTVDAARPANEHILSGVRSPAAGIGGSLGPTVAEAIEAYLSMGKKKWTGKTFVSRQRRLGYLEQHLGGSMRLADVTPDHVRSFRDGILSLRKNRGRCLSDDFAKKQTSNEQHQIVPKTAELIFEPVKAFLRWSKSEQGYIRTNPAEDIRIAVPKKVKGKKSRRPFAADELALLFSAPLFKGCQSRHRRFEVGSLIIKDAKYWIPVLGLYTGARLGELVQLHIADVDLEGPIPFIHITEEGGGPAEGGTAKHVKSEAGVRQVPLHPDILKLGFGDFLSRQRKAVPSSKRLFPDIKFGSDGQASTVFSKWFGRFLDETGLKDPALVFHSFRHNAEDAFRNAGQQQYVIDRIIGHADSATSAKYGEGISLETAFAAVCTMKHKFRLAADDNYGDAATAFASSPNG